METTSKNDKMDSFKELKQNTTATLSVGQYGSHIRGPVHTVDAVDVEPKSLNAMTESEDEDIMDVEIRLSMKRWLVLFVFSMITTSNGAIWITMSSINNIIVAYYRIPNNIVNWLSMSYLLSYAIVALPASVFLSKYGLKTCIVVAASLDGIGSCLRYAGIERNRFIFAAVGQTFAAVASAFVLQVPPKLAAVWFGEHERARATSIGVLMNIFGVAVGFIQPTFLVQDSEDMNVVRHGMTILLLSQACFCIVCLIMAIVCVDEKPKLPPSRSEALRDETTSHSMHLSLKKSVKMLFKSKSFNLTSQAYGLMFGLLTTISTLLNQTVKSKYKFVSDLNIGLLGFTATMISCFVTLIVGISIDKFQKYKLTAVALFLLAISSMAGFTLVLLHLQNFPLLFAMFCLLNIAIIPFLSSGLEQISEITYPVEEDISCAIPLIFGNFYGFLLTYAFGWLIDINMVQLTYLLMTALFGLGLVFIVIAKVPMRRSLADHGVRTKLS